MGNKNNAGVDRGWPILSPLPLGLCNSNKGLEAKWYRASVYVEGLVTL